MALAREREISALGAQAAAEAHLLGTPLATINVIAKELVHEISKDEPHGEDVRELLGQVQRCRDILGELRNRGRDDHTPFTKAPLATLLEEIAQEYARPEIVVDVVVEDLDGTADPKVVLSPGMRHSLANLVDNAIQFAQTEVLITVRPEKHGLTLLIEDDGPGFPPEVLDRLGEPYFSTRYDRGGLGLGVFIAMSLLARSGARLHFDNTELGACVSIQWMPFEAERFNQGENNE
ncbi:MAG: ATP-binding protein [Pseudomonadota bacterium]